MHRILVGVAVILKEDKVLIAKRHADAHQGGKWEFPGGKVEVNETVEQALARELKEELDIDAGTFEPLMEVSYDYPDKNVSLQVYTITDFDGVPRGVEGQRIEWVALTNLARYEFPDANVPITEKLLANYAKRSGFNKS